MRRKGSEAGRCSFESIVCQPVVACKHLSPLNALESGFITLQHDLQIDGLADRNSADHSTFKMPVPI